MTNAEFKALIEERIKTWEDIYEDSVRFDLSEGRMEAVTVIGELKSILEELEK